MQAFGPIYFEQVQNKIFRKLTLTCVSDEETFGPWGSRWLIDNEPEVLGDCCLNGEPSSPFTIRYGEKGLLWLTLKSKLMVHMALIPIYQNLLP